MQKLALHHVRGGTPLKKFLANPGVRYLLTFAIVALALFSVLSTPWADKGFTQPFTRMLVDLCAALIGPFDSRVLAEGDILRFSDGRGAVQVLAGCNAVEVCALLVAAILSIAVIVVARRRLVLLALGLLALRLAQHAGVVLGVLQEALLGHAVVGQLRVAGKRQVFFNDLLGRAAHLALGTRGIEDAVDDIAQCALSVRLVTRTGFG